jgi:hypothetical protein
VPRVSTWANFVGYQLVWFAAVTGAARGWTWPALLCVGIYATWQLGVSRVRGSDACLAGAAMLCGALLDGLLRTGGVVGYAAGALALPSAGAPLWILALWVSFALTINHSLQWLSGRPVWCAVLGAAGGPLAYAAAARLGAVTFAVPASHALAWLALGWCVACVALVSLARLWRGDPWISRSVPT